MGWRFRRSIGGKYLRLNLGRHGVNSVTFGGRGIPHVTTGRTGTRVGASIPGTGLSYTRRIGGKTSDAPVTQRIDATPTITFPAQSTTATPPPSNGGRPSDAGTHGEGDPLPWSRLAITSLVLGLLALVSLAFKGYALAVVLSLAAIPFGIAGLIVIRVRRSRRSTPLAVCAIILAIVLMVASSEKVPTATSVVPNATHSVSSARKASQRKKQEASKQRKLAEEKRKKEARQKLDAAKSTLTTKLDDARRLLDASNGNVADSSTRDALNNAIAAAAAIDSTDPDDWTSAVQPLQSAMDAVTASENKKQQDDAAAAQAAQAQAQAQAEQQRQVQQNNPPQQLQQAPPQPQPQQVQPQPQSQGTAHGGAFCSPEGAQAQSDRSSHILTCRVAADGRLRWKL